MNVETGKIIGLETKTSQFDGLKLFSEGSNDDYVLAKSDFNEFETSRLSANEPKIYLINTLTGASEVISEGITNTIRVFSPAGKYVYWSDPIKNMYFTYNIQTGTTTEISALIPQDTKQTLQGFAKWADGDRFVFLYDQFDIWKLDPDGLIPPVNITNAFGKRHSTVLRFINKSQSDKILSISNGTETYLCAFNKFNKYNGFYKTNLRQKSDPKLLTMCPEYLYFSEDFGFVDLPQFLVKAKKADVYMIMGMSDRNFPNLKITSNFITYTNISSLNPYKNYNWLTAELVAYMDSNSDTIHGILYKPENFDARKKIPDHF